MTSKDAIVQLDALRGNPYDEAQKLRWLDHLEGLLQSEVHRLPITQVRHLLPSASYLELAASFPDEATLVLPSAPRLEVGGTMTLRCGPRYAKNDAVALPIVALSPDGRTVTTIPGAFSATGEAAERVEIDYDGRSVPLLVPHPYDVLYVAYLIAMLDLADGDYARYRNSLAVYNGEVDRYARYVATTMIDRK